MADTQIKVRPSNIALDESFDFSTGTVIVDTPSASGHATPKNYVDTQIAGIGSLGNFEYPSPVLLSGASTTVTITGKQKPTKTGAVVLVYVNTVPLQVLTSNSSGSEVSDVVLSNSGSDLTLTFNASLNAGDVVVIQGHLE